MTIGSTASGCIAAGGKTRGHGVIVCLSGAVMERRLGAGRRGVYM
jgi:hypothetical protein